MAQLCGSASQLCCRGYVIIKLGTLLSLSKQLSMEKCTRKEYHE